MTISVGTVGSIRSAIRLTAFSPAFVAIIACGRVNAQQPIFCDKDTAQNHGCTLTRFDRPANWMGRVGQGSPKDGPNVTPMTDPKLVWAINSPASKILYSGTIISAPFDPKEVKDCQATDWRVALLSRESSNIVIYGPADISEFCDFDGDHPADKGHPAGHTVLLVVPVAVIWAQVFHYSGNDLDPLRKPPGPVPAPTLQYCMTNLIPPPEPPPGSPPPPPGSPPVLPQPTPDAEGSPGGIRPCDADKHSWVYKEPVGRAYNYFTQSGSSQGTISFSPAIATLPSCRLGDTTCTPPPSSDKLKETLSFDVQLYPSAALGRGWIGLPIVFEKALTTTASLDSLTAAISYDIPFSRNKPQFLSTEGLGNPVRLAIRPPDFRIQYGPEFAPGGQTCAPGNQAPLCGTNAPHDLNMVAAATLRLPVVLDFHSQPSALSIFPVVGVEGGNRIQARLDEQDPILRKVAGFDSSLRIPFILTHQFLGDKPMTIDFAWRTRYLSYPEPFTDYVSGVYETLTKQQRSYWRGSFVIPASTLVQFKVTVQHGGLPPDFDYLGYSVNLGFTFLNPGYSEH